MVYFKFLASAKRTVKGVRDLEGMDGLDMREAAPIWTLGGTKICGLLEVYTTI